MYNLCILTTEIRKKLSLSRDFWILLCLQPCFKDYTCFIVFERTCEFNGQTCVAGYDKRCAFVLLTSYFKRMLIIYFNSRDHIYQRWYLQCRTLSKAHIQDTAYTLVLVLILNPLLHFFLVYQADVSIFYTSNLYWWGKGWPVDGLPFPDTGCPVPDVSIYYMSNINELPDGILFHWFCKCTPPWMFLPLDIPSEYRPEHVTFGLLCVIFKFPSRIFCRRVPGFATDCPCGVWCRGLTTCLLYVGPPLEF